MTAIAGGPRVFVSHANADSEYVDKFVNNILIRGAGLRPEHIFYSSAADTGVRSGEYLMEKVRKEAGVSQLIIALITPTYQARPVCVAELGAAWARGVLFPVKAPGLKRSELEGVLPGLLIKSVDDDDVLDEIADRVRELGFQFSARSLGVGKAEWKSALRAGSSPAALSSIPTQDQLNRLEGELTSTQIALDQAKNDLEEQLRRNDKLSRAKSVAEVREADLPADEGDRFEAIRSRVREANRGISGVVVDAVWHHTVGRDMYLPGRMDDPVAYDEIVEEAKAGRLVLDEDTGEVNADPEFPNVEAALSVASELMEYLDEADRSEAFVEWFKKEFGTPMNLSKKDCWDAIV